MAMAGALALGQKNAKTVKTSTEEWDTSSFSYSIVDNLPPKYRGHSYASVIKALYRERSYLNKDEFESTSDYAARLARLRTKSLIGKTQFGSRLAFNFFPHTGGFEVAYDADSKRLNFQIKWENLYSFSEPGNFYSLRWDDSARTVGSYIGRNAFNAKVRVKVSRNEGYYLVSEKQGLSLFLPTGRNPLDALIQLEDLGVFQGSLQMEPADARQSKANMRMLVIGRLADRFLLTAQSRSAPTITSPIDELSTEFGVNLVVEEIWVYDFPSGRVWSRFGPVR